jgi:hypothetical protein
MQNRPAWPIARAEVDNDCNFFFKKNYASITPIQELPLALFEEFSGL